MNQIKSLSLLSFSGLTFYLKWKRYILMTILLMSFKIKLENIAKFQHCFNSTRPFLSSFIRHQKQRKFQQPRQAILPRDSPYESNQKIKEPETRCFVLIAQHWDNNNIFKNSNQKLVRPECRASLSPERPQQLTNTVLTDHGQPQCAQVCTSSVWYGLNILI